jgi:hypothetical protein
MDRFRFFMYQFGSIPVRISSVQQFGSVSGFFAHPYMQPTHLMEPFYQLLKITLWLRGCFLIISIDQLLVEFLASHYTHISANVKNPLKQDDYLYP